MSLQRVAVYGTLKREQPLHTWLVSHTDLLGEAVVKDYALFEGDWYPAAVPEKGGRIRCEVYSVPNKVFNAIHQMECNAGYYDVQVETDLGPCVMWAMTKPPEGWTRVARHHEGVQEWP